MSPFVGRWEIDRASTWLTVWELAFGMAKEADMPADLYDEMAAKIDEVVDSMAVVMTLDEDGSLIFESQMMGQAEISQGTWAMREDGSVDLTAQSEQSGETIAIGSIGGDQFVMISPVDPSGFGTIKFNRVSK